METPRQRPPKRKRKEALRRHKKQHLRLKEGEPAPPFRFVAGNHSLLRPRTVTLAGGQLQRIEAAVFIEEEVAAFIREGEDVVVIVVQEDVVHFPGAPRVHRVRRL